MTAATFSAIVKNYYKKYGRDLPWRHTTDPYRIVVSEIMLQQTQVSRVLIKYPEWLKKFPTWKSLALASTADVIKSWQGLGYNRRALALKKIAEKVVGEYKDRLPNNPEVLETFPGIGPATARSICAFAFNLPVVFIETNIRRVYIHHFFGDQLKVADTELLPLIEKTLDRKNSREWYWALMDYGSYLVKQVENPNRKSKHYSKQSKFEGSRRQVRGEILKLLKFQSSVTVQQVEKLFPERYGEVEAAFRQLVQEGFIVVHRGRAVLQ